MFDYLLITKNKEVIKKFIISLLILSPFIFVTYPISVVDIKKLNRKSNTDLMMFSKETNKYIADRMIIPCVKVYYTYQTSLYCYFEIQEKFYDNKTGLYNVASDEAKMLIDEEIKYLKYTLEHTSDFVSATEILQIIKFGQYDDALYLIECGEKNYLKKPLTLQRLNLYYAQNEYQKALDYINQFNNINPFHYAIIYAGLKDYDKAYEYCAKLPPKSSTKIYLDYKTGKRELAQQEFNEIKSLREKWTLDEYIIYYENAILH